MTTTANSDNLPRGPITGGATATYDPTLCEELRVREGLPNFFAKLNAGKPVSIAYLGGSITAANGWRPKTLAWFRTQYPKASISEINAAISGTGSDYGAVRLAGDVLDKHPDLVFMEHRVNGGGGYEAKSVEGIVRQIWNHNPKTDICLVYTISEGMLSAIESGKEPAFGVIMESVANAYGVPSIDFGPDIAARVQSGSLVFKSKEPVEGKVVFTRDGVHPGDTGHELYAATIGRSMLTMASIGTAGDHVLRPPLSPTCWEAADLVPVSHATLSAGWTPIDLDTDTVYRDDFGRTNAMLRGGVKCAAVGETITVRWTGTTLGFSDIPQGQGTQVEITIDGGAPIVIDRPQYEAIHTYARFFYLPESAPGEHTAVLRVKTLLPGVSYYAGQILVIGKAH
jgi:lysophospholipase L1-like esterase